MSEQDLLRAKLNAETARIPWPELARFHAQGKVLVVSLTLDLVDVAAAIAEDRAEAIKQWMDEGAVLSVGDDQAADWQAQGAEVWAVVVAPWVLVQAAKGNDAS